MPLKVDYVVRETFTNLRRNVLTTLAAVLTVTVSLFLVGGALLLRQAVGHATTGWKGGVELSVFLKPDVTDGQKDAIQTQLSGMKEVKRFRFVSKEDAYQEFKTIFASSPDLVESVTAENLPPSFRVVPQQAEQVELIGQPFRTSPGVYKVVYAKDAVDGILRVTDVLQIALFVLAAVLLVSAVVLILNTIQMAIFARRREVGVMKLVGATNWFIRIPFMFEGMLQGLVGAVLAGVAVWAGAEFLLDAAANNDFFGQFYVSSAGIFGTGLFLVFVGAAVGAVGSAIAVSRFLDV